MDIIATGLGPFGRGVVDAVQELGGTSVRTGDPLEGLVAASRPDEVVVVVMAEERRRLLDAIDVAAHQLGRTWMPVVLDGTTIRLGPMIVPGRSACYRCFLLRRQVRSPLGQWWPQFYAACDTFEEPEGRTHPRHEVRMAAGAVLLTAAEPPAGRARWLDPSGAAGSEQIVPLPDCRRCRAAAAATQAMAAGAGR